VEAGERFIQGRIGGAIVVLLSGKMSQRLMIAAP